MILFDCLEFIQIISIPAELGHLIVPVLQSSLVWKSEI